MSFIINPFAFASVGGSTPSSIASIWEWWEPSREVGLVDNDPMGQLTGQANGRHWTESNASNKPTFKENQINSTLAAVRFAGSPRAFGTGPNMSALTEGHIFLIVKIDNDPAAASATSGLWKIGTDALQNDHYPFTTGQVFMGPGTNNRVSATNPTTNLTNWNVLEVVTKSNDYRIVLNGTETIFSSGSATIAYTSTPKLGNSLTTPYLLGYIAGMYMFSAKLGTTDRATMVTYINSRFGLSMS